MTSQSASSTLSEEPLPDGRVRARLLLACGCEVEQVVDARRFAETVDGLRFAAGKYPCPKDHPAGFKPG